MSVIMLVTLLKLLAASSGNLMIVTVDMIKEHIRGNIDALDAYAKLYEELNEERFEHTPASINFGKKTLRDLLQVIETLEMLPEVPNSNKEQFQLVEGKKTYAYALPVTNDDAELMHY